MSYDAAYDFFIGRKVEAHSLASCGRKCISEGVLGWLGYGSRSNNIGSNHAASFVEHQAKSLRDLSKLRKSLIF